MSPVPNDEFVRLVDLIAKNLLWSGHQVGDGVIVMAPYTWQWLAAELAILRCGGVVIGVDGESDQGYFEYVLQITSARFLVTDSLSFVAHVSDHSCLQVMEWENLRAVKGSVTWPTVLDSHTASIVFTSGTTGQPKGIAYSHGQIIHAIESIVDVFAGDDTENGRVISWLPLHHLFQRIINLVCLKERICVYFLDDHKKLLDALKNVRPTVFLGVPKFYEYIADEIVKKIVAGQGVTSPVARYMWKASQRVQEGSFGVLDYMAFRCAHFFIFRKIKKLFGGKTRALISGSAPVKSRTLDVFELIGMPIMEAYGVSENVVPIAMSSPIHYKKGSVGRPLSSNMVKITEENQICVKGYGVCTNYISSDHIVSVDSQGYLNTGDVGYLDQDGFLFIQGRCDDFIKLSNGKKMFPAQLESLLEDMPIVDQAFVTTNDASEIVALVYVNRKSQSELEVGVLDDIRTQCNKQLKKYEHIRHVIPLDDPLSVEGGDLTATQKYKRFYIKKKFIDVINNVGEVYV